ncbi:SWI2/SNF2-containing protein [Cardiosporidium cionae]|uniref:SWI2/SNF2-containing protein n=1 Tax=Cardiosporidium cionae TaxID=476202 RepID=A0ABQ7JB70_9APIC|nr:SWI2/SNF2-containing protein [Cardiosporidium cionae]|eukprot:KAF8821208.1 SWI2/SNF2-containing protein [Cardiosporidium cionae]
MIHVYAPAGLGKTLQALAFLCWLMDQSTNQSGPFLVICPLSVVQTWIDQLTLFCPSLRFLSYSGSAEARESLRKGVPLKQQKNPQLTFSLLITTYEFAYSDVAFLSNFQWQCLIVDEAHRLKNSKSKLRMVLMEQYSKKFILLLTGTPIQNNLHELWSLLNFLHPSVFSDLKALEIYSFLRKEKRLFIGVYTSSLCRFLWIFQNSSTKHSFKDISSSSLSQKDFLHSLLRIIMLRRTLSEVSSSSFKQIEKIEYLLFSPLTIMQRIWYKWLLTRDVDVLLIDSTTQMAVKSKRLGNLVMQLRKCCNHPYLFDGAENEPYEEGNHIWKNAGKMIILEKLLVKLKKDGSRVLIFSGSTQMLDIIQDFLTLKEYLYERLDGSMRGEDRFEAIKRFTRIQEEVASLPFIFLLSSRSACVGLNLATADAVILYDSDWNPQIDRQAIARVYRQGQTKRVSVFRLLTRQSG